MKRILLPIGIVVLVAIAGFAAYSVMKPKKAVKMKITGTIYVLQKGFVINLKGGQYATLTVGLELAPGQSVGVTSPTNPPPTGFGSLTDEAPIRAIITNDVTDQPANVLLTSSGRQKLEHEIVQNINTQTDTKILTIYLTDIAVQ